MDTSVNECQGKADRIAMRDMAEAAARLKAAVRSLDLRMRAAAGDLDYESYLHEKRALEAALFALSRGRAADEKVDPGTISS